MAAEKIMPVLFIGHGSPMNAIEENRYTAEWIKTAALFEKPKAILAISAHWYTLGSRINDALHPKQIYDMYGFPDALYALKYPAKGSPQTAQAVKNVLPATLLSDNSWGIDHGVWSILGRMYPQADIPVVEMSIDRNAAPEEAFLLGQALSPLRAQGVLILCSGNVVHNLSRIDWNKDGGYDWADRFDNYIRDSILHRDFEAVKGYHSAGADAELSFSTPEHFLPLLYMLGASSQDDNITVFNKARTLGSLSMTSYMALPPSGKNPRNG